MPIVRPGTVNAGTSSRSSRRISRPAKKNWVFAGFQGRASMASKSSTGSHSADVG